MTTVTKFKESKYGTPPPQTPALTQIAIHENKLSEHIIGKCN